MLKNGEDLTQDEVFRLIEFMADCDPIVVGGQSVNLWATYYSARDPSLAQMGPFTSKDLDLFANRPAAQKLASNLTDARIMYPGADDATPNDAVVIGTLGNRRIVVDFMASILGVDDGSITDNYVAIAGTPPGSDREISLLLMNPYDCVRSRLSNVNKLHRIDLLGVSQAIVSMKVLSHFIDDLLDLGEARRAQRILLDFQFVIRDEHLKYDSYRRFGDQIDAFAIPKRFTADARLDQRFREHILAKWINRLEDGVRRNEAKMAKLASEAEEKATRLKGSSPDD